MADLTDGNATDDADDQLVSIRVPADAADELTLLTVWLSLNLDHRVPIPVLRRALMMTGLDRPDLALSWLKTDAIDDRSADRTDSLDLSTSLAQINPTNTNCRARH
jgi:hypothetical protein